MDLFFFFSSGLALLNMGGYSSKFILSFAMFGLAGLQPLIIGMVYLFKRELIPLHADMLSKNKLAEVRCFPLSMISWGC